MRPVYLRKDLNNFTRKIMLDMAYLVSHKKVRLPKYYFEDNLYFCYMNNNTIEKYFLSKDKIIKEDENHFYFNFPFKEKQLESVPPEYQ
jgi:hypothetical protein